MLLPPFRSRAVCPGGRYYLGVPGPASASRLGRIAAICEVTGPSSWIWMVGKEPGEEEDLVLPTQLVRDIAGWCERAEPALGEGEVSLHLFPFGGLERTVGLMHRLADGAWPPDGLEASNPADPAPRSKL